ncbi:hypothetical protein Scep_029675 [Stephania cephalantha]|uniref:Uncharacterized protein n=1 Tax=Stephania cephalantha TaxID=152367 RepID=A0AAP0HDQ1_9MAGN
MSKVLGDCTTMFCLISTLPYGLLILEIRLFRKLRFMFCKLQRNARIDKMVGLSRSMRNQVKMYLSLQTRFFVEIIAKGNSLCLHKKAIKSIGY